MLFGDGNKEVKEERKEGKGRATVLQLKQPVQDSWEDNLAHTLYWALQRTESKRPMQSFCDSVLQGLRDHSVSKCWPNTFYMPACARL